MKRFAFGLAAAFCATSALADPLGAALDSADGIVCFTRSYDDSWIAAHPGQTLREAKFMVTYRGADPWQVLRMSLKGAGGALYVMGDCQWLENVNRDTGGQLMWPNFKPESGVGCMLLTDVTGASAEEGGFFVVDWQDAGQRVEVHFDDSVSGWRSIGSADQSAEFAEINPADRIVRLERAEPSDCDDLAKFAEGEPR